MATKKELQAQAKALGMKHWSKANKDVLEEYIAKNSGTGEEVVVDTVTEESDLIVAAAVILRPDGHELRRYTPSLHGEDFVDLAKQFANKKGLEVQYLHE